MNASVAISLATYKMGMKQKIQFCGGSEVQSSEQPHQIFNSSLELDIPNLPRLGDPTLDLAFFSCCKDAKGVGGKSANGDKGIFNFITDDSFCPQRPLQPP